MKVKIPQDKAWKEQREARWKEAWEDSFWIDGEEDKEAIEGYKTWFIEGDLAPLMSEPTTLEKQDKLSFYNIIQACPIMDIDDYLQFFQDYSYWLSEKKLSYWGHRVDVRDRDFLEHFFAVYSRGFEDSTKEIYEYMLKLFLPNDDGIVTFPYKLGVDEWQPKVEVKLWRYGDSIFTDICRYLFGDEDDFTYYFHLPVALPFVHYIKDIDPIYFGKKIINAKMLKASANSALRSDGTPEILKSAVARQQMLRKYIGNLHGYRSKKKEPLRHNDTEVEKQLRDFIDDIDMPKEYYQLLDFIKEFPDDYVIRSKKN